MVSFINKCLCWVVWRTNPNNSRTFLGMCCLVGCYLVTIGLALESGLPLTWSKNMLRLQLLSKNFERECPLVRFIKLIASFWLLGEHTLVIQLGWKG